MSKPTVIQQRVFVREALDKVLPAYKGVAREVLDQLQAECPDLSLSSSFTRGGTHLRGLDGKPNDYIPDSHFVYEIRPHQTTAARVVMDTWRNTRTVTCPFCGAPVRTCCTDEKLNPMLRSMLIVGCPNFKSPEPPKEYEGQEVCGWLQSSE